MIAFVVYNMFIWKTHILAGSVQQHVFDVMQSLGVLYLGVHVVWSLIILLVYFSFISIALLHFFLSIECALCLWKNCDKWSANANRNAQLQ